MNVDNAQLRVCPTCRQVLIEPAAGSKNIEGATLWSDGKIEGPHLTVAPALVRCPACQTFIWVTEAENFAKMQPGGRFETPTGATLPLLLTEADFLEAIQLEVPHGEEQEVYVRAMAWQCHNDAYRQDNELIWRFASEAMDNLEALFELQDEKEPVERLMKAELARERSDFTQSLQLLAGDWEAKYRPMAETIRKEAGQENPCVVPVARP